MYTAKKIRLPDPPRIWIETQADIWRIEHVAIDRAIIYRSSELATVHGDPFDRLIIATAIEHGMRIVTPDPEIAKYPVSVIW